LVINSEPTNSPSYPTRAPNSKNSQIICRDNQLFFL
jgi:hypothetical protein